MSDDTPPPAPDAGPEAPVAPPAPAAPPPSTIKPVNCPNCGGTVNIRVAGTTVNVICEHCGSTLDATSPDLQVIAKADQALKTPQIPLGTRGVLYGITWEAVGYQERTDDEVRWAEYLLFNPYEGYAFLIDDGRRFSLGRMLTRLPATNWGLGLQVDGQNFSRFGDPYRVRTIFVVGEFYWRVTVGETVTETDFVKPGTMVACEDYEGERTWTRLDMLDWGVAEKAFGIDGRRVEYSTPAPHERSPWKSRLSEAWILGGVAAVTLFIVSAMGGAETQITTFNAEAPMDGGDKTMVISGVELPAGRNRVSVVADAPTIDNAWVDIDYSLTDPSRKEDDIDAYGLAEFYEGYDSDGRWTEGERQPDVTLSSVPGGRYDLVVTLSAHKWNGGSSSSATPPNSFAGDGFSQPATDMVPVTVSVRRGGVFGGNILLGLILLLAWPVIVTFKHLGFEKRRKAVLSSGSDDSGSDDSDWGSDD